MVNTPEKQNLPKFSGDGSEVLICPSKTCVTIQEANGQDDQDYWLIAFLATLCVTAIDWYRDLLDG